MKEHVFVPFTIEPFGTKVWHAQVDVPWVSFVWLIGSGSISDPVGKEGTAHVLEHQLSTSGPKGYDLRGLEAIHSWLSANQFQATLGQTGARHTIFKGKSLATGFEELFGFMAAFVFRPMLDGDIAHDHAIVRSERVKKIEARTRRIRQRFDDLIYGGHRLSSYTGLPEDEVLFGITPADTAAFHENHYRTGNATLMVLGGIGRDELERVCARSLQDAASGQCLVPLPPPFTDHLRAEARCRDEFPLDDGKPAEKIELAWCWCIPPQTRAELQMTSRALGVTLFNRVRERLRLTYDTQAEYVWCQDLAGFSITCVVSPEQASEVETVVDSLLEDPHACLGKLEEVKRANLTQMLLLDRSLGDELKEAVDDVKISGLYQPVCEWIEQIKAVEEYSVDLILRKLLRPEYAYRRRVHK